VLEGVRLLRKRVDCGCVSGVGMESGFNEGVMLQCEGVGGSEKRVEVSRLVQAKSPMELCV